ncbi:unnamed protein product [Arctogadus glacialis]
MHWSLHLLLSSPPPDLTLNPHNALGPAPPPDLTLNPHNALEPAPPSELTLNPHNALEPAPPPDLTLNPHNALGPAPPPDLPQGGAAGFHPLFASALKHIPVQIPNVRGTSRAVKGGVTLSALGFLKSCLWAGRGVVHPGCTVLCRSL